MNIQDPVTINEARKILGTYDKLLLVVARREGVTIERKGRVRYISRNDIEPLRPHVEAWHNRPRISELVAAATAS